MHICPDELGAVIIVYQQCACWWCALTATAARLLTRLRSYLL